VLTLMPTSRRGGLYRADLPAAVLADVSVHDLVFKPPGRGQVAVVLHKTAALVAWLRTLPRQQRGKVIGPFRVDTSRHYLTR
jgi:hypothetical protein